MEIKIIPIFLFIFCLILKNATCIVFCGKPMCFSSNVIKPGEPINISWHRMHITNKIQISLLYGDTSLINDCHILDSQVPLKYWSKDDKAEDFNMTIDSVDFEIKNKKFVILLNYLAVDMCMMGPEGAGDSYLTIDSSMPFEIKSNKTDGEENPGKDDNKNKNDNNNNNKDDKNTDNDSNKNSSDSKSDELITFLILGIIALIIIVAIILLILYKRREKKNKEKKDLKLSSNKLPADDEFTEGSVYSAVNINNIIPASSNESFNHNVSVESFNSANSKSGLISRHEAKMIADRFRHELQNPLNNELEEVSSIKGKTDV